MLCRLWPPGPSTSNNSPFGPMAMLHHRIARRHDGEWQERQPPEQPEPRVTPQAIQGGTDGGQGGRRPIPPWAGCQVPAAGSGGSCGPGFAGAVAGHRPFGAPVWDCHHAGHDHPDRWTELNRPASDESAHRADAGPASSLGLWPPAGTMSHSQALEAGGSAVVCTCRRTPKRRSVIVSRTAA